MMKYELDKFINEKIEDPTLRKMYFDAELIAMTTEDTLTHEFQLAAAIERVFWEYAERHLA
jgi:hypothetical protein